LRVWRLCRGKHAAFDGEGARLAGGRWNPRGLPIVYTSETLALAALELLVHCDAPLAPADLVAIAADVPEQLSREEIRTRELPSGWRRYPAPEELARFGAAWARRGASALLAVPSAVVPSERNFLLNPAHPEFAKIRIAKPEPFTFDGRLKR
jgi:RES domain-containing protein